MSSKAITVRKSPGESLGLSFSKKAVEQNTIFEILPGSALEKSGQVKLGDKVLSINRNDVRKLSAGELIDRIAMLKGDSEVSLEIQQVSAMNGEAPPIISIDVDSSKNILEQRKGRQRRVGTNVNLPEIKENTDDPQSKVFLKLQGPYDKRLSLTPEMKHVEKHGLQSSHSLDLSTLPTWRGRTFISLQNYWTGEQHSDRLHHQAPQMKNTGCHTNHCVGSQIWPKDHPRSRPYAPPRPKDEMKEKAKEYIKMYYDSLKAALGSDYNSKLEERMNQVMDEIEEKGHYDLTSQELTYAARLAWRNAPRCVNRIVWRQLEMLDARDCNTPKEMFEAICHHLKYATNGGNLRSTITVFRHRTRANSDFRVWNEQVIRYAGYKNSDGSVTGDPSSVEFTEVCRRLGWVPPNNKPGMFHVLPLVLQANGGQPEWFDIPRELVMEVEITHPEFKWFADLGLKWYAIPAVSGLLLDVGGLEFTACPFNGWYMSSEIGGRNLTDEYRYNMLKPVAEGMGLNTASYKLWKDRALVEMNRAVLYSYQKANVSIVDHHTATEGFMTFFKNETAVRGGCPGDWVWIVPPISGGCTKVFHQEMLLYYLTPSYEYMEPAWKYYQMPGEMPRLGGPRSFRAVAAMVRDATRMMRKVRQRRIKATVLYATETGMSKNYASVVTDLFNRNFNCSMYSMDEYNRANLEHEQLVLVVTSTFGSGDPPANGESFGQYLMDCRSGRVGASGFQPGGRRGRVSAVNRPTPEQLARAREDMIQRLSQVKYGVFGLGSRAYPNFCAFAHTVDNLLMALGAEQIYQCGEGDEMCGQEESFQSWLRECYLKACEVYQLAHRLDEEGTDDGKIHKKDNFRIKSYKDGVPPKNVCRDLSEVHNKRVLSARIKSRTKLQSPQSDRSTILVALQPDHRMPYKPGDHLTIYPQNHPYLVNELLERISLPCDPDEPIIIESESVTEDGVSNWSLEKRLPCPTTIRDAFTYFLDITTPPTPQMLQRFRKMATRKFDQDALDELALGRETYEDWKYERYPNLPEVLNQFHSLKLDAAQLLMALPLLQCRYYSISSSPKMHANDIHITVAVVTFRKRGGRGPRHHGVCSTWLNRLERNSIVPCTVRTASSFHMPDNTQTPIIMVGPGTGIAPFRSFWQERMYMRSEALKRQLLSASAPRTAPVHVQRGSHVIPDTPANRLSIGSMGGPSGPQRRQFVSTITAPMRSLLEVEIDRQQAPVSDLDDSDTSDEANSDEEVKREKNPEERKSSVQTSSEDEERKREKKEDKRRRKFSNRLRRSASDESQMSNIAEMVSARQSQWGTMSLYFGCRRSDTDYIFKEEITRAHITGAINDVNIALSREPGVQKTYVQDLLKKNADSIVQKLMVEKGHFYVCGDVSMAADVGRTLQNIFEENAAMSANEARQLIENMKDNSQYHEDIFGVTLKTAEVTNRVRTAAKRAWRILITASDNNPMTPLSSRPPLTPNTPGYDSSLHRPIPKRPTVTVLTPAGPPSTSPVVPGSRLISQPDMYQRTKLLRVDDIMEEPSEGAISITEYTESSSVHPEILNPTSLVVPYPSQLSSTKSTPSVIISQTTGHDTGQDMVVRRQQDPSERKKRRMKRKIKSQSLVETDV